MKKNIFKLKQYSIKLVSTVIILSIAMTACKKEETTNPQDDVLKTPGNSSMRIFNGFTEFHAEVEKTLAFSMEQLVAYEKSIGFDSYGKLADQAMNSAVSSVENEMVSAFELPVFLNRNSNYLQTVTEDGEAYCETRYYNSPYRYVMNEDCMFQVDDLCFKVFENGHVSGDVSLYYDLLNLTEEDLTRGPVVGGGDFTYFCYGGGGSGSGSGYGHKVVLRATEGKERVKCKIYYAQSERRMIAGCVNITGALGVETKGYRKALAIWWNVKRTITNDLSACLHVYDNTNCGTDKGTTFGFKKEQTLLTFNKTLPSGVTNENIYISSISGTAKIPAVTVELQ